MTATQSPIDVESLIPYSPDLERPAVNEQDQIDKITCALHKNNERAYAKCGHGIRDAHAKSHGILRGELKVLANLEGPLRQGLFATPETYPVMVRLSTTAGVVRSDQVRGVRGLAIKVLGAPGPKVLGAEDPTRNQDFVFVSHPVFPTGDAKAYLWEGVPLAWTLAHTSDRGMLVVNATLRGVQRALKKFGRQLPDALSLFAGENTNTLGETFYTAAPIRFGKYIAKLNLAPLSPSVKELEGKTVPTGDPQAHTHAVEEFFAHNGAEYVLSAQLCKRTPSLDFDKDVKQKIEDATFEWSEEESPYLPIATISYPSQNPYSPARKNFGDDVLEFNSWRAIVDHRPMGSINRLKLKVYVESSKYRHQMNNVPRHEPSAITEMPN